MYRTIDNLHDYRLSYSDAALIPKLTQCGLLRLIMPVQDRESKAMNASSNFRLAFAQRFSQELKSSGGVSDDPQRNGTSLKWSYQGRNDMSTFTFGLTLLLLATTGAAQTDNPTFWLLIGPAPFAVVFAGLVFFRHGGSPKRTTKPLR